MGNPSTYVWQFQVRSDPNRYLTIDRWRSEQANADFRHKFAKEYAQLERECKALTSDEQFLGAFSEE